METLASPAAISGGSGRASKSLRLEEYPIQDRSAGKIRCCSWKKGTGTGRFIFLRRSLSGFWIFRKWGERRGRAPIARREHRSRAQREIKSGGDRFSAKRKLLFQRNIKVRHTETRAHLCKSRPCRMQNGTSVASPFPNVSQKKREGKHNNGAYGRATSARTRRGFGNRQRRAPTGSPRPPSLHYCFCIILLNVAAERGASGR